MNNQGLVKLKPMEIDEEYSLFKLVPEPKIKPVLKELSMVISLKSHLKT